MSYLDASATVQALVSRVMLLMPPLLTMQRSSWEQGVACQALLELHVFLTQTHSSREILPFDLTQYLYGLVHDALVRQASDGRLAVLLNGDGSSDKGAADHASLGETLYFLLLSAERQRLRFEAPGSAVSKTLAQGAGKMLRYVVDQCPRAPISSHDPAEQGLLLLSHVTDGIEIWSDTMYMIPPFLVSSAVYYLTRQDAPYDCEDLIRLGLHQILLASHILQVSPNGRWYHIYDLAHLRWKRKDFWGVGNGWVCCGIVRVLRTIILASRDDSSRATASALVQLFQNDAELGELLNRCHEVLITTITGCLQSMRLDGLFYDVLDDSFTFVETNLAQMLSYAIYRLLDLHLSNPKAPFHLNTPISAARGWEEKAERMREAAMRKTDERGFVRDVCGSPTFDKPGTAPEGQAWGIMMEVARTEYLQHKQAVRGPGNKW